MDGTTLHGDTAGPAAIVTGARAIRTEIRAGRHQGSTEGLAPGAVQGNVAIFTRELASDFQRFCYLNPKPCPLIGMTNVGDPMLPMLGDDIDIRTDVPQYRVFHDGAMVEDVTDISHLWTDDMVAFVLGCSYSFEEALIQAGLRLPHIEAGCDVPVFRTNIQTTPAGPFGGDLVVSMRAFTPADAIRAIQITSRFPNVHGAPVHFGDPAAIGIADINKADWCDSVPLEDGQVPVFWACGVTPQVAIERARPPLCITHRASHMLISDRVNAELASF
jgi:uncharacterized protein YcsI (UPF0317 family)